MPLTVTPNEDAVITALRSFLLAVLPDGFEVIKAQANRVPEPISPNFVLFTPLRRMRLATNADMTDTLIGDFPVDSTVTQATMFDYQLDIHGDAGNDAAQIVSTLMRDEYATTYFDDNYPGIAPLYANDPKQMPFINAEKQYEDRWVIEVSLQANPAVVFPQQYADTLAIDLVNVDAEFPAS